jgi:tRNA(Ile)-lysidine synthase
MTRSHPPTLLKIVGRTLREECALGPGTRIVLGVSGGIDSSALLHVLARLRARFDFELAAHGVDHGLRAEASAELEIARELARGLTVPFATTKLALPQGGNLQARARQARYEALLRQADAFGDGLVATAHHADDRAETVLLRLLRGAGIAGLAVLPARAGRLLRPMVRASRADVALHAKRHGVGYAEDPSNRDSRFLRVRIRRELLPLLTALSPQMTAHLNALADEALGRRTPAVVDELGNLIVLGRAQRELMERARRFRQRKARIPIGPSLEVRFDPETGSFSVLRNSRDTRS